MEVSSLQQVRYGYRPKLPPLFTQHGLRVRVIEGAPTAAVADAATIAKLFPCTYGRPVLTFQPGAAAQPVAPLNVGVLLSGGQAPGGHNVIAGLFDALLAHHPDSRLYGFENGPGGLVKNKSRRLDAAVIDRYRNTGGFDIIGSDRTKLEDEKKHIIPVVENCRKLALHALVIVGGDDSNTNAGVLAEYLAARQIPLQIVGCPKTIDGDLKNPMVEVSFGFDTATKLYSELIGNIARDANSAKKYWHFVRLMGRSASHVTLECALQTHPNIALISEEVEARQQTLNAIVQDIASVIAANAAQNRNFGVALIPEGLIEFIPEVKTLIRELNDILAAEEEHFKKLPSDGERLQFVNRKLTAVSAQVFGSLPGIIQIQLLTDRDKHGQVQVSRIETEKLLIDLVGDLLREWKSTGKCQGSFSALNHFLGYEGRCATPSNFDADYCYSLGYTAAALIAAGKSGIMAVVRNLARPAAEWQPGGVPLTMLMNIERRKGKDLPVIRKSLVDLDGQPFQKFKAQRASWQCASAYLCPGPIQYFGPAEVSDSIPQTLALEHP